jgi:WD40 repeat protein
MLLAAVAFALPLVALLVARADDPTPLSEADLLKLVELQISNQAVVARVEKAGVAFKVDDVVVERLKKAGASDEVLATLRKASGSAPGTSDKPVVQGAAKEGASPPPVKAVRPLVIKGHTNTVYAVTFSPDGKWIGTGSGDNTIRIWDAATGERKARIPHTNPVYCIAFSPDSKTLASGGSDGAVTLWDVASGEKKKTLPDVTSGAVVWIRFAPDGHAVATFGLREVRTTDPVIWDVTSGKQLASLQGHTDKVNALAFSPDGKTVVTVSKDSTIRLWDAVSGKEKDTFRAHDGAVYSAAFSPDGRLLATGGGDKTVIVWNLQTGNVMKPVLEGHKWPVWFVSYLPDGRILSRAIGGGLFLWKHPLDKPLVIQKDFEGYVDTIDYTYFPNEIALSPDGRTLAVGAGADVYVRDLSEYLNREK